MKKNIIKLLLDLEREKKINIIFAVESGSRAWGMESANSDYDVRFVYARPSEQYLQVNLPEEVIAKHYNDKLEPSKAEGCMIDAVGFDIFKFVRMLVKSNPTCIEWLESDVHYLNKPNEVFKKYAEDNFNPIAMFYHYKSMCKQNYIKYIDSGDLITYKKYLYAMRGLVSAEYIRAYRKLPSIKFPKVLEEIMGKNLIPDAIIQELQEIIRLKKESREGEITRNYQHMDSYIESFLKDESKFDESKIERTKDYSAINEEIQRIIQLAI